MADIDSNLPTRDITDGTPGAAAPALAEQVAGSDGTNLRVLSTDTTGKLNVNNISGTIALPTGASTSANQTNGSQKSQIVDGSGNVIASTSNALNTSAVQSGTWNINNISGVVSLPTGASTSALQITGNSSLASIDGKLVDNYGAASGALRVAAQIGNATAVADFNAGASSAQTLRVAANTYDGSGNALASNLYNSQYALQVKPQDGPQLDNLQRLRVSETSTIISLSFANSPNTLQTGTAVTGSATIAQNISTSSMRLTTTSSSSDSAILQTDQYVKYNPGRSYFVTLSGNMGAKKANTTQKWGFFDTNDGMFFSQNSTNLSVTLRTSSSGSPVDTVVNQSSWNLDKLDGTGASGYTLDTSKHNLYIIDYLWHGAGRVRFGVDIGGTVIYCHQISGGNVNTVPYTRTPVLPVRAELTNTGTVGSSTTMDIVCFTASRESVDNPATPAIFSASRGTTTLATTGTLKPLISIRPKTTFAGIANRIPVVPQSSSILAGSQSTLIIVYLNATLTGAAFTSADTNSSVEYDVTATAITGGTIISQFYVPSQSGVSSTTPGSGTTSWEDITLGLNVAGTTADILTIAAVSLAGGTNTFGAITWKEFQ